MKKKIAALMLTFVMLISVSVSAKFSDVNESSQVGNAIVQLSNIGIINGYGDGKFYPDETLTRGQFAKIAVCMLGEARKAETLQGNAVFIDVASDHWARGYINLIAEKGIINGYPDGSFGAEETLNYAQALTILVRLLGYSGEDVGYKWPDGYISLAKSLGITDGMTFGTYESVTRANAAYLVYNTLVAEKKEGSAVKLLSNSSMEDVVIYGDWEIDAGLSNGNISTTKGVFKLADSSNISSDVYGAMGTLYLDAEQRATAFVPENETVHNVVITSVVLNSGTGKVEITYTENSNTKTESLGGNAPLYYRGKSSTLAQGITEIEAGIEARLYYTESGVFERMYLKETSLSAPLTVINGYSQVYSAFNITSAMSPSVIRDGQKADISDISMYDVVYYMESNNTLYVYSDKISGTYQEAYPLKASVTGVKVGGREYELATQTVINKMNESSGAFAFGDRVTLLFGRNGEVVDAVDMSDGGNLDLAVLTECYTETSTDAVSEGEYTRYVKVVLPDGGEVTYEADRDYSDYIGSIVKISYSNNKAKLSTVAISPIYGEFDSAAPSLDGHWLASNCAILELVENNGQKAVVQKINVHDIVTTGLAKNQVIHAVTSGSMKDITFLYVTDVTKTGADFGVVIDSETRTSGSGAMQHSAKYYTVLTEGREVTVNTSIALSKGSAVEVVEGSEGTSLKSLHKIGSGTEVTGYATGRIRVGSTTYVVSDYVKVYGGTTAENYHSMSVNELVNNENVEGITLYSDRSLSDGGIVRVIVVRTKK